MRFASVFLALLVAVTAEARVRAVRHLGIVVPESVLWIAAHPDDEAVVAPLLSYWCRESGARCAFLLLTRGEAGPCLLPEGCFPDVRTVRSAEAASAAELFHADLTLLRLPDGGVVLNDENVATVAAYIEAFRPQLILTFDPRHGTTCHPDHRETGRIVVEATRALSFASTLYLLETRVDFETLTFSPATPFAERFDAASRWNAVIEDMQRHPSQFDAAWLDAIGNVQDRAVYIAPANEVLAQPVRTCD